MTGSGINSLYQLHKLNFKINLTTNINWKHYFCTWSCTHILTLTPLCLTIDICFSAERHSHAFFKLYSFLIVWFNLVSVWEAIWKLNNIEQNHEVVRLLKLKTNNQNIRSYTDRLEKQLLSLMYFKWNFD